MPSDRDTVSAYHEAAARFAEQYESLAPEDVHGPYADLIPRPREGTALDVGAGSGRDAAWLASLGYTVTAVEPAGNLRAEGQRRHAGADIRWLDDRLPALTEVHRLGIAYDVILLSAVWMHVHPGERPRAFRKLVTLLKPGGILVLTLREGPADPARPMWPTSAGEVEALARDHGLTIVRLTDAADRLGRPDVGWRAAVLRLADDGTGALPLLRGIILNDDKSSTYKLALLRAVARIADLSPGVATVVEDGDAVELPLGLVALNWVRMYLPLVSTGLPQAPGNAGPDGLGFAKEGFRSLLSFDVAPQDLRVGAGVGGERAAAVVRALTEARATIARMPATYITYPASGTTVFGVDSRRLGRATREPLTLSTPFLRSFGTFRVPGHVWRAMQRLGAWIEPVLVNEWARIMREYGERAGRHISPGEALGALVWTEPGRDTATARLAISRLADSSLGVRCVWTGTRLKAAAADVDHCLPWSAWPCDDLWNLVPAARRVNQDFKRDRLPSAQALAHARESILGWWERAWLADPALSVRFCLEAEAALPVPEQPGPEAVFSGLEWRRLRLRQDQQVEEWAGPKP